MERHFNAPKPNIEQHFSFYSPRSGSVISQKRLKQACCRQTQCKYFIDSALFSFGNTDLDERARMRLVSSSMEGLFTKEGGSSATIEFENTLRRNVNTSLSIVETLVETAKPSTKQGRTVKPRCMLFNLFELKIKTPRPLLVQEIFFFATTLLATWERYRAQSNMYRRTNQCIVSFQNLAWRGRPTLNDELVLWRPT